MKKILIAVATIATVAVIASNAAMVQRTISGNGATNNTDQTLGSLNNDAGVLYRAQLTTSGGSVTVSIVDTDGTVLVTTNALVGTYTYSAGTSRIGTVRPSVKTKDASTNAAVVTVKITLDK